MSLYKVHSSKACLVEMATWTSQTLVCHFMHRGYLFGDFSLYPQNHWTWMSYAVHLITCLTARQNEKPISYLQTWTAQFQVAMTHSVRTSQIKHAQFCAQVSGFLETIPGKRKPTKYATNLGLFANVARLVTSHQLHTLICHTVKIRNLPCPSSLFTEHLPGDCWAYGHPGDLGHRNTSGVDSHNFLHPKPAP